jgi:threonine dehydrogenase-like Zn-dependent dehydrogenase
MAAAGGAITINFEKESVVERLNELTRGEGPDKCIDIMPSLPDTVYSRAKQMLGLEGDRPHVLREMIYVCRPAGIISIPSVYAGVDDKIPMGALMNKGLTIRTGQTHVNRWTDDLLRRIEEGRSIHPLSSRSRSAARDFNRSSGSRMPSTSAHNASQSSAA